VAGDVHAGVEREQRVERGQPRLDRSVPHHRHDADEEDVGGEHDADVGQVRDRVGGGVRRADVEDADFAAADVERRGGVEQPIRAAQPHATPVERREHRVAASRDGADATGRVTQRAGGRLHAVEHARRRLGPHRAVARRQCEELDAGRELSVPPPVVAVGVRDERLSQRRLGQRRRHRVQHPPRQPLVPQRVHQQGRAVADDQARV